MNFIPANESRLYIRFFKLYTNWLLKRRFKQVWIKKQYQPNSNSRTVYFLNHNSWWDGLIPLYLNENFFFQNARAVMEDKQMGQYPFFSRIGAFSVNLKDSKATLKSLRYALESLNRTNASLFIYPEGKIKPVTEVDPDFKKGLAWLYSKTEKIEFVPVYIYMHSFRSSRHELYINIDKPVSFDASLNRNELTALFESSLSNLGNATRSVAGITDDGFTPQF